MRMLASVPFGLALVLAVPAAAQDVESYPVPGEQRLRDLRDEVPYVVGAMEERVVGDCEAAAIGGGSCVEVLAWAAGELWSDEALRMDYAHRAVTAAEEFLAANDPRRAIAYTAMARALKGPDSAAIDCEKPCPTLVAAEVWLRRAAAVREAAMPRDFEGLAATYRELAGNLYRQGRRDNAKLEVEKIYAVLEQGLPQTATTLLDEYFEAAEQLQSEQQAYAAAEPFLRRALAIVHRLNLGNDLLAQWSEALADNLLQQGKFEDADRYLFDAYRAIESELDDPERSHTLANILVGLAATREASGAIDEALGFWRRIVSITDWEELRGPGEWQLPAIYARFLERNARSAEAETLLREWYGDDRMPFEAAVALGRNLNLQGKFAEAETVWRVGLQDLIDSDEWLIELVQLFYFEGLGVALLGQDRAGEALPVLEQGTSEWVGQFEFLTLMMGLRHSLAQARAWTGDRTGALEVLADARAYLERNFAASDPIRIRAGWSDARLMADIGARRQADRSYQLVIADLVLRISQFTDFGQLAVRDLRTYRPIFLESIANAWRLAEVTPQ